VSRSDKSSSSVAESFNTKPLAASPPRLQAIGATLRKTDETSERQWDDVSRLITLLGNTADLDYLRTAAESVGVSNLLERLIDHLSG
jgi:hypothetical protein